MSFANLLWWALTLCLLGGLGVLIAYFTVRAGSIAYFRTKLDFLRNAKKLKNGERNGI